MAVAKSVSSRSRSHARGGRPARGRAGEVDERILEAAEAAFLERGYEGATIDEIAQTARAGKPTIYARFPGKDKLFAAVMARKAARNTAAESLAPHGRSFQAKLVNLGIALLDRMLADDTIGLVRSAIAEARRFPGVARTVNHVARQRVSDNLAGILGEMARAEGRAGKGAFAADRITDTAQLYLDLMIAGMMLRCLMGDDAKALRGEVPAHVRRRVNAFLAACEGR
jgi:AcrR family transcriptional regulator